MFLKNEIINLITFLLLFILLFYKKLYFGIKDYLFFIFCDIAESIKGRLSLISYFCIF